MSEDIQRETASRRRQVPREESAPDSEYLLRTLFPWQVFAAAVIWINSGGLVLAGGAKLLSEFLRPEIYESGAGVVGVVICGGLLAGFCFLWCAALTIAGIQAIRGASRGILLEGIGSIVISLSTLLCATPVALIGRVFPRSAEAGTWVADLGAVGLFASAGLLAAGILALRGRRQYERWRQEQRARPE